MIIVPELRTVVLLVPRTSSGSLRRAIKAKYPDSFMVYRHMEADGIPAGYDRYEKVGLVRRPVERLWSLYKFLRDYKSDRWPEYGATLRKSVQNYASFSDWLLLNQQVFTSPYDTSDGLSFHPMFNVRHSLPETRKSQWLTLRPDLGTQVFKYGSMGNRDFYDRLGISANDMPSENKTDFTIAPRLSPCARRHVEKFFAWDLEQTE